VVIKEKRLEMRGMGRNELIEYFNSIGEKDESLMKFTGQDWEVEVNEENIIIMGSLAITSTVVVFRCEEKILEKMLYEFRLRFLTAGG
jgi:hypothetical protein